MSILEESLRYGPHGSTMDEVSVQDVVDLLWSSFPEDDTFVVEEWLGGQMVAIWRVPNYVEGPPTAHPSYRQEI